jgi:hypothetical protein
MALFSLLFETENGKSKTETPNYGLCANNILASSADWQNSRQSKNFIFFV